jgi:hypothetical protein
MGNLMTIGEFSCRSGLSAKVFRAYASHHQHLRGHGQEGCGEEGRC